jgi:hypothetical protein
MRSRRTFVLAAVLGCAAAAAPLRADDLTAGLQQGTPDIKFAGPLAFGPEGILFVGDSQGAAVFALDTGDRNNTAGSAPIRVEAIDGKIASMLGTTEKDIQVNDLAVNPLSGNAYLSLSRGKGPDAAPVLLRVNREGKIEEVQLKDVKFAKAPLPHRATGKGRQDSITHLAFVDGRLLVSGLSNEEFASQFLALPFPFKDADKGASVEIYHGSHGRFETNSPVRTFTAYEISGQPHILAAYTCTPLVKIPIGELRPGARVKGTTVAELGNMNRPLDMIVYQKDGKDYILMANNARGVMKISTDNIDKIEAITSPQRKAAGLPYQTIASMKGVLQLDRLDKENVLILVKTDSGTLNLETVALP